MKVLDDIQVLQFDSLMHDVSVTMDVPYFNFMPDNRNYQCVDGDHMERNSAKRLSKELAGRIKLCAKIAKQNQ